MNKQKVPLQRPKAIDLTKLRQIDYFGLQLVVPEQVYGPMEDTDLSIKFLRKWLNSLHTKDIFPPYLPITAPDL